MEYFKSRINFIVISFYFVIAFSFSVLFLGLENISFTSIDWIFHGKDMTHHYVGWSYFKNDIWRFPPGSNPMYGLENASSIVYSDSIPLLAFFFKIFKNYLPNNFQYFSFWIFLCFFLQGLISFKLINFYTNNILYSLIAKGLIYPKEKKIKFKNIVINNNQKISKKDVLNIEKNFNQYVISDSILDLLDFFKIKKFVKETFVE